MVFHSLRCFLIHLLSVTEGADCPTERCKISKTEKTVPQEDTLKITRLTEVKLRNLNFFHRENGLRHIFGAEKRRCNKNLDRHLVRIFSQIPAVPAG